MEACDRLGCADEYTCNIVDRGGNPSLTAEGLPVSQVEWGRQLDATSTATLTIPTGEAPECCGILADVRAGRHEVVIWRDDEKVWEGPIVDIRTGRDQVVINAQDVTAYLARHTIPSRMCWGDSDTGTEGEPCDRPPEELGTIALEVLQAALGEHADEDVLPYLIVNPVGETGERDFEPYTYASDILEDLGRTTLDYTAIGRRIVIGGPLTFGTLAQLRCDSFAGDVESWEDATIAATRVIVRGDDVVGIASVDDPYYGVMDLVVEDDTILDQTSADFAARQILATSRPPLVYVVTPSGSELSTDAPVCINQLVPGALVPVYLDCTCRPAVTVLRLTSVSVTYDNTGEHVKIALTTQIESGTGV